MPTTYTIRPLTEEELETMPKCTELQSNRMVCSSRATSRVTETMTEGDFINGSSFNVCAMHAATKYTQLASTATVPVTNSKEDSTVEPEEVSKIFKAESKI